MKSLVIAMTACAFALHIQCAWAQDLLTFYPEDYGALADDGADDRAAIQSALDDAGAAGGGTVQLGAGVYHVLLIVANGFGGTSGYHGLLVPPGCTLNGNGMENTTVTILAGTADPLSVGDGIINAGYQTALTDFGGGGNFRISHLRVNTPDTMVAPTGILIGMAHADGVTLSSVALGSCRYHGVEINLSRNVLLEDCVFDGEYAGSSTLQLDMGGIGAKSVIPRGTVISDVLVRRCQFRGRSAEQYGKVIELGHTSNTCIVRNVAFEDCYIESIGGPTSACVTTDNPAGQEFTGMRFERCQFHGVQAVPAFNALLQFYLQGTQTLDGLIVRDCQFTGQFWQGVTVISTSPTFNTGHSWRRNILIEGNIFTPVFDRAVPTNGGALRMVAAAACSDLTVRRNLFECPPTAVNLTLSNYYAALQVTHCLDSRIEDNVFTWAHTTAASAPLGRARHIGITAPHYLMEQNATKATIQMTGNIFLHPVDGIASAVSMTTGIPTTSWAGGGPWVGGLLGGNFSSGGGNIWNIQHDLSGAANIGQILPADPSRPADNGWYNCNGAALTLLDLGSHSLARSNAVKCGYDTNLPVIPGNVVRLHGSLKGEGLLAPQLSRYAGSTYRGTLDSVSDVTIVPFASLTQGDIRVVRHPLTVFRWEASLQPIAAQPGSWAPADKPAGTPGFWVPLNMGVKLLENDSDLDGDGLTNLQERAFLCDPAVAEPAEVHFTSSMSAGDFTFNFTCATGAQSPKISILSSEDMVTWELDTSSHPGAVFQVPLRGTLVETPVKTGRAVSLQEPSGNRRFWRVVVE